MLICIQRFTDAGAVLNAWDGRMVSKYLGYLDYLG